MCFRRSLEQTAIISLYLCSINRKLCNEEKCVYGAVRTESLNTIPVRKRLKIKRTRSVVTAAVFIASEKAGRSKVMGKGRIENAVEERT